MTEDVQYEDPLLRIEGWQEIEQLTSVLRWKFEDQIALPEFYFDIHSLFCRRFSEYALLQIDSVQHNQEKVELKTLPEAQGTQDLSGFTKETAFKS